MDCVLQVIEGPDAGQEYPLTSGSHVIGRGSKAVFRLSPEDVSWEHAVITRDGDDYFIENLSALGTWVGEAKISGKVKLRPRDTIRLSGECVLRMDIAGGGGLMASRGALATGLILMVSLLVALMFFKSGGFSGAKTENWDKAYQTLETWLGDEAKAGRLQPEAVGLFRRAWRLAQASDWEHAVPDWMKMQIVVDESEGKLHCIEQARAEAKDESLNKLLFSSADIPANLESHYPAALAEFVTRYGKYCAAKLKDSEGATKIFGKGKS